MYEAEGKDSVSGSIRLAYVKSNLPTKWNYKNFFFGSAHTSLCAQGTVMLNRREAQKDPDIWLNTSPEPFADLYLVAEMQRS